MVVVLVLIGILACGVVAGLVLCPKARAAQDAYARQVRALAARTGWRSDRAPVPNPQVAFPGIDEVLGSSAHHGIQVTLRLSGPWRGVPVRVLQLRYRMDQVAYTTSDAATMVLVPRPAPGPSLVLRGPDDYDRLRALPPPLAQELAGDLRMQGRALFFTDEHVAAVVPGELTQPDVIVATADLLADLTQRLKVR